jgi:hypothetical protein
MRQNTTATDARNVYQALPYYGGPERGRMSGGFGQSRDSDPLEASNFAVAFKAYTDAGVDAQADSFNHWAVGWVEELTVPITRTAIVVLESLRDRVESYPVLDDEDFSQREWDENHPNDSECYSDDPDCGCAANVEATR